MATAFEQSWQLLKRQTELGEFVEDETLSSQGPVRQWSAQPLEYFEDYGKGGFPEEFWSLVDKDPEKTRGHGKSRHRVDDQGRYLAVGIRSKDDEPIGDLPTRGPFRPRKGVANYPQDYGVRVISREEMEQLAPRQIVRKPMRIDE